MRLESTVVKLPRNLGRRPYNFFISSNASLNSKYDQSSSITNRELLYISFDTPSMAIPLASAIPLGAISKCKHLRSLSSSMGHVDFSHTAAAAIRCSLVFLSDPKKGGLQIWPGRLYLIMKRRLFRLGNFCSVVLLLYKISGQKCRLHQ